jgi:hypothetical protein
MLRGAGFGPLAARFARGISLAAQASNERWATDAGVRRISKESARRKRRVMKKRRHPPITAAARSCVL